MHADLDLAERALADGPSEDVLANIPVLFSLNFGSLLISQSRPETV